MITIKQRLMFAATRFPRKAQLPNGERGLLVARIRKLEHALGRQHRWSF